MIPFVLSTLLTCEEGSDLIKKLVKPSLNEADKVELTESFSLVQNQNVIGTQTTKGTGLKIQLL